MRPPSAPLSPAVPFCPLLRGWPVLSWVKWPDSSERPSDSSLGLTRPSLWSPSVPRPCGFPGRSAPAGRGLHRVPHALLRRVHPRISEQSPQARPCRSLRQGGASGPRTGCAPPSGQSASRKDPASALDWFIGYVQSGGSEVALGTVLLWPPRGPWSLTG